MSNPILSSPSSWLVIAALGLTGCYAHASTEPVWVEADYTPARIEAYPHTVYEGRVVYLVNDHWYTRERGRWVYYRVEPEPLYRQRVVVQQAPPAPHRHAAPRVVRERRYYDHDGRHHHHDGDRMRERRNVHEAPPAIPRVRD
jgi:hypothetical protein